MIRRAFLRAAFAAAACGMLGVELRRRRPEIAEFRDAMRSFVSNAQLTDDQVRELAATFYHARRAARWRALADAAERGADA